ncbi:MAG: tetratricopeptide repeat protein, partial [Promethearchaeota archaeon]
MTLKELSRAELLLKNGDYDGALEIVEKLASRGKQSSGNRLTCQLLECRIRVKLGELEKSLPLIEKLLLTALEKKDFLLAVDTLIVKAEAFWLSGRLDEGLAVVEKGEKLLEKIRSNQEEKTKQRKGELLSHRGIIYWYKGNLDQAQLCLQRSLQIWEEKNNKYGIADSLNNLGLVFWSKGDLDQALECYQRSLKISEELGNMQKVARLLNNLGNLHTRRGDLDQALECHQRSLSIKEKLGGKYDTVTSLINLGVVHQLKGELDKAWKYYQQGLAISEELGSKRDIALAINNLGNINQLKGELDQALEHFQRSLAIYRELGIKEEVALLLTNIGEIHRKKGNFRDALDYDQQGLAIFEELGNDPLSANVLFELVWLAIERDNPTLIEQYLAKLQQINERTDNRVIDQRFRIAKALSLKASKRARHRMKAEEILEQVVEEEVVEHSLTVTAMIHLCDLLLSELKMTGEEELFGEIKNLTQRLLVIAKQQSSHSLLAETYLLKSKLALMELDMGQARKLLETAYRISEEKGYSALARRVAQERDLLQSQMQKWESIFKQNPSRQELIDLTRLDSFLEQMIQKTVANLIEEKGIPERERTISKYKLVYLDLLKTQKIEKETFRVGIAQIGLSKTGNLFQEFYKKLGPGLFGLRRNKVKIVSNNIKKMVANASSMGIDLLIFPELTIDLNYPQLFNDVLTLAKTYTMYIIPGSYHEMKTKQNRSIVVSPDGILWEQEKHIPATIHYENEQIAEGIDTRNRSREIKVGSSEFGRIAIVICRDFLDMDLRVELKNSEPPIDLIINPAFTPVTADFKAAHFDARRSIYAYCFFANVA